MTPRSPQHRFLLNHNEALVLVALIICTDTDPCLVDMVLQGTSASNSPSQMAFFTTIPHFSTVSTSWHEIPSAESRTCVRATMLYQSLPDVGLENRIVDILDFVEWLPHVVSPPRHASPVLATCLVLQAYPHTP